MDQYGVTNLGNVGGDADVADGAGCIYNETDGDQISTMAAQSESTTVEYLGGQ